MTIMENYCRLCADHLESYVEFASLEHLTEIQKINFPIPSDSKICTCCFDFLLKMQNFIDNSFKVQNYLNFLASNPCDELSMASARTSFGLQTTKCHQSTDTSDLGEEIAVEILEKVDEIPFDEINEEEDDETMQEERLDEEVILESDKTEGGLNFEEFEYICHLCNEQNFKTFFALHAHTRKAHDSLPQVFCPCGSTLKSRSQILHHKKIHKSTKTLFNCTHCEKVYTHAQSLQNHTKKCHGAASKSHFECPKCSKILDSERKLKIHEQTHLPDDKKSLHECPIEGCDKKFSSKNVQAHVRAIHGKERPFCCEKCGKSFATKGGLKEHQIIHTDQFPYACQFCDKKFKNLPRLKTHEDTHGKTQYICNICGISLNTKRTLKMHMVVHSDLKRFKCEFCGSMFKRSKALKNHLILHTGLRPYSCNFCNKTFANGSNCRSHKKKAHPQELAAFEAAGKAATTPNIPRLDELMLKGGQDQVLVVDESGIILQDQIVVLPASDTFQIVQPKDATKQ